MNGAFRGAVVLWNSEFSQQLASMTQSQIEADVRVLEEANAVINQTNDRTLPILESLTNQNFGIEPKKWTDWWADQLGFVVDSRYSESKPTITQLYAPEAYIPHSSCFAAGTLVQTVTGPRKIETIALGDRVLSQHTSTGGLSFDPVLATHVNDPPIPCGSPLLMLTPSSPREFTAFGKWPPVGLSRTT